MFPASTNAADQRKAAPGRDAIGRDNITNHNHFSERRSQIDGWLERLSEEMLGNHEVRTFVESLQYYFQPQPYDDVIGLEAKLDRSGRSTHKVSALRKKEAFAKLLAEWSAYPSAQEVIAYFLSKIETTFETEIVPLLTSEPTGVIDTMVRDKLIMPVLDEMGCGPFMLNYANVAGMVYWLAEQCYVRWHS